MTNEKCVETATRQCENCGEQRYEFEACMTCGHKHWVKT